MASPLYDVRLALRSLRRSPLFATVAILSLALGIGANAAIFRLIDQLLLRTLPVKAPDELVMLYQQGEHMGNNLGARMHSYPQNATEADSDDTDMPPVPAIHGRG